ncbi:response regulator [Rhodococcus sp. 2H158]
MIRVLLADDHGAIRAGLAMILSATSDLEVVGEAADGDVAVRQVRALRPDVVLMDIRMPGTDGIEATRRIRETSDTRVLVLTTFDVDEYVLGALRAGAAGFLLKSASAQELTDGIRRVAHGDGVLSPQVTRTVIAGLAAGAAEPVPPPSGVDLLTEREREVLDCLGEGLANQQIAERLNIGATTVKTHVSRVLAKLGVDSRLHAAFVARQIAGR